MQANLPPDDLTQRLVLIRRHLHGLELEIDRLEHDIQQHATPRTDAELAVQRARNGVYTIGPHETKVIT